jgi:hypothetical protein
MIGEMAAHAAELLQDATTREDLVANAKLSGILVASY